MKIVVTGGIGSGKSTVTQLLSKQFSDFHVLSIDKLVSTLYDDPLISSKLIERLGSKDKKTISDIVFKNEQLRHVVESLFATQITDTINRELEFHENIIIEFPLLFEKGKQFLHLFDVIVAVIADPELRTQRVNVRDGFSTEKIAKIMQAQISDDDRIKKSDLVIENKNSLVELEKNVIHLADDLRLFYARKARKKIGMVSGSFDPITLGHAWVIEKALDLVDYVVIAIAQNPSKKYLFSDADREELVRSSLAESLDKSQLSRVALIFVPEDEMTISIAHEIGAKFIFRGLRGFGDLEYESQLNLVQKRIDPEIETIFLLTPREYIEVSSSLVKGSLKLREWEKIAKPYVSSSVFNKLSEL